MRIQKTMTRAARLLPGCLLAALLAAACTEPTGPRRAAPGVEAATTAGDTVRISGQGTLGPGPKAPGNPYQELSLDVSSDLSGSFLFRDWSVVRPDGSAGQITVSPTDTATSITAFRDSSATCPHPADGVEFEGIGRVNTQGNSDPSGDQFLSFTAVACDEGPAGSNLDEFALSVPGHGYTFGPDRLTSGDIAKTQGSTPPPSSGDLTVTATTTGSNLDPDGYTVTVDSTSQAIGINGSVTFSGLAASDHTVTLSGVASNCTVSGSNPRTVTVPSGGTASTTFSVSCTATGGGGGGGSAGISGTGALGTGTATAGSSRQDFDFDATASLTGHIAYTDWSVVRADGSPGRLTVSPTDTATHITAFRNSSSICADPTHGAEYDGIGRVNSGGDSDPSGDQLLAFTVQACDNGPGSGDVFAIQVPSLGYAVGPDSPTSGDIVKSSGGTTGTPTHLAFTTQPSNVAAGATISPAVQVTAQDSAGNTATGFSGTISVAIGSNPGGGTLSGTTSVAAVSGVATFSNLSVNNPGTGYTLTAAASGLSGATSAAFNVTASNQPPTANFTFTCSSLACNFTSTSSDPDGSIASYGWTFGDGSSSTAQNPSHTYAAGGSYTVTLTVTDNQGASSSPTSKTVSVAASNQAPVVNAGPNESALIGLLYTENWAFSDPDNGPWSYTIDWGDGSTTSGSKSSAGSFSAGHTYVTILPHNYTVHVTVVDSQGASGSDSKVVSVLIL